jgi:hypothetical protein
VACGWFARRHLRRAGVELRSWRPRGGRGSLRVELRSCRRGAGRGEQTVGRSIVRTEEETADVRATMGRPNLTGVWAAPKKQPKTSALLYCCIVLQKLSTILASKRDMERLISIGAVAELISFKWWLNWWSVSTRASTIIFAGHLRVRPVRAEPESWQNKSMADYYCLLNK